VAISADFRASHTNNDDVSAPEEVGWQKKMMHLP